MGLIKAAAGLVGGALGAGVNAVGGTLADQWKEFFYCDAIPSDILVKKGEKRTGGRSANTKGTDNVITDGSVIAVADGQCMIIVEQGKVAELCAEPGEFIYDNKTAPTIFNGNLGESIMDVFKDVGKRFTFGGEPPKDQRVYYFNTKEIFGNKYGTAQPILFRMVDPSSNLRLSVDLKCSGEYSYRIVNPILFYSVCGNVASEYRRDGEFGEMMRREVVNFLPPTMAKISALNISPPDLPMHHVEICAAIKELTSADWGRRGIEMVSFTMPNVGISEEHMKIIRDFEQRAVLTNATFAGATLVDAQAKAMQDAAKNQGGAMTGFMGLNMAGQSGGMNAQNLFQMGQQQQAQPQPAAPAGWTCSCGHSGNTGKFCADCGKAQPVQQAATAGWTCSCGHSGNTGKFCADCGKPQPQDDTWTCSCGAVNKGKFCAECGKTKPAAAPRYKCDKCGWEPEDPAKPPKFCPECGDTFDEGDIQ